MVSTEAQKRATAKWKKVHREQYNAAQSKRAMNKYHNDEEYRERKKEQQRAYQKERYYRMKAEQPQAVARKEAANVLLAMGLEDTKTES